MVVDTKNPNEVTELEVKEEARLKELAEKQDISDDEKQELENLKKEKTTRYQKRLDTLTWRAKSAEEKAEAERIRKEELEEKVKELEGKLKVDVKPSIKRETVEFEGQKFYTDETLVSMIRAGEITEQDGYTHQRARDRAEDRTILRKESEEKKTQEEKSKIFKEDLEKVLKEYPHFNKTHPSFNPDDPLYKKATELWNEGLNSNPRGLSKAIELAKQILRISDDNPDLSEDLNIGHSNPTDKKKREEEVTLSEDEKDNAIRMFTKGDVLNPSTGRPYTENEAVAKALFAKKNRLSGRKK